MKIGALPAIEVTRAAAEVSASKEDLLIAQTNVAQQEIVLKNALNRNSMQNTWLDDVHIIPLDHIEVPKTEEIRPITDLIQEALDSRLEIERSKINIDSSKILLKGDKNGLIPELAGLRGTDQSRAGWSGKSAVQQLLRRAERLLHRRQRECAFAALPPQFSGLLGGRLTQHSLPQPRGAGGLRDRPTADAAERTAIAAHAQPGAGGREDGADRAAAGARAYQTAVDTRALAEQSLKAEQSRFQYGVATVAQVIQAQKDLATAQDSEVQAMANYTHAKIAFDLAMGRTLEVNHISMEEAISGQVQRESVIPNSLPAPRATGVGK